MNLLKKYFRVNVIALIIASSIVVHISPSAHAEPSTILGSTGANPTAITIDSSGNIYTANFDSNNVSKITPGGVSTILGSTGTNPIAITIDSSGNIYTANYGSNNVSKITVFDQAAANTEDARVAAAAAAKAKADADAAASAESARRQKQQQELTEIMAIIPIIGELTLSLGEITRLIITRKPIVSGIEKKQLIKVSASELKQIQKLGKTLALKIAESNKGSVNEGAVASFAEGVRILYGK